MVARRPIALPAALDFTFDQIQVLWFQVSDFNAFFFSCFLHYFNTEFKYDGGHQIHHQEEHLQISQFTRQRNQNPQGKSLKCYKCITNVFIYQYPFEFEGTLRSPPRKYRRLTRLSSKSS